MTHTADATPAAEAMFAADKASRGLGVELADSAFACARNSHGPVIVAAGADVAFVAPAHEGDVLVARAEERTRFGHSGLYDVSVLRDDEVIAEFRGRSRTNASTTSKESR